MKRTEGSDRQAWLHFPLVSIVLILIGAAVFVWYVHALLFGVNSLSAYTRLKAEKAALLRQAHALKLSNQKLQKKYFELIQLNDDSSL